MRLNIGQVFSSLSSAAAVSQAVRSLIKNTRGTRRSLLLELQKNINLIYLYTKGGAPIDKVVAKLEVQHYENASQAGFDFNALKKRAVRAELVRCAPRFDAVVAAAPQYVDCPALTLARLS